MDSTFYRGSPLSPLFITSLEYVFKSFSKPVTSPGCRYSQLYLRALVEMSDVRYLKYRLHSIAFIYATVYMMSFRYPGNA